GEVAGLLPLARAAGVARRARVLEVARGIAVARLPDEREQRLVARDPGEAVGLLGRPRGAVVRARRAAIGIVDEAKGLEAIEPRVRAQDAVPVDAHAEPLGEDVGVEPAVAAGRLVPNLAAGPLRGI